MEIILAILSVYYVTTILTETDGPFDLGHKLREVKFVTVFDCFICTSLYVSAIASIFVADTFLQWVVLTLAISGGAVLAHGITEEY